MAASPSSHGTPARRSLGRGATPAAILAALLVEAREAFDRPCGQALDQARRDYDITPVLDTIEEWRRQAIVQSDPAAFRVMACRAPAFFSGELVRDEPFHITLARAGM